MSMDESDYWDYASQANLDDIQDEYQYHDYILSVTFIVDTKVQEIATQVPGDNPVVVILKKQPNGNATVISNIPAGGNHIPYIFSQDPDLKEAWLRLEQGIGDDSDLGKFELTDEAKADFEKLINLYDPTHRVKKQLDPDIEKEVGDMFDIR